MSDYQAIASHECVDVKLPEKRGKTLLETLQDGGSIGPPTEEDKKLLKDVISDEEAEEEDDV